MRNAQVMKAELGARLSLLAAEGAFSGVASVVLAGRVLYECACGLTDRSRGLPNTPDTQFALASGAKGFTALGILSLVADGLLELDAAVHRVLPEAAELVEREVTVRQLLAHTSGMGDYLDEHTLTDVEDYQLPVPAQQLACPLDFLPLLRGQPAKFRAGAGFSYCNSGYVLLARISEVVSGCSYHELVAERVCKPAGLRQTAFLRLDQLPRSAAVGYTSRPAADDVPWRSNEQSVPVCGGGDGGIYSTLQDLARLWSALHAGRIVPPALVSEALRTQHSVPGQRPYGLGFWLTSEPGGAYLEGSDPGISFRSRFEPRRGLSYTVLSNTTRGAWPLVRELEAATERGNVAR